ncbi:MAG: TetR/AcrR family transcriptional regulator [Spirochaetes bacterium]|nr:TetR/AcrR family transcriptional regulator [Spirochaetota bacterium]
MGDDKSEDRILRAAQKEFAQHGFDGARIDRIAKRAGINKAMIYYYYKNKESLYEKILKILYTELYHHLKSVIPTDRNPDEQLLATVSSFMDHINSVDENYIRIMLREIGSGGKYFKKVALPNLLIPMFSLVAGIFEDGKKQGYLKDLNTYYTFLTVVGSVVIFNAIRMTIGDTDLGKTLFKGDCKGDYKKNFITVLTEGILK